MRYPAVAALGVTLTVIGTAKVMPAPEDGHEFMADEAACGNCHQMEADGENWILDPHLFTVEVVAACRGCYAAEQLGRPHPVGMDPFRALNRREMPAELPLHWSDEARSETVTCGTCHNPHMARLSSLKLFSRQRPCGATGQCLTYYLRIRGKTPREGFTPLCHTCHPDL